MTKLLGKQNDIEKSILKYSKSLNKYMNRTIYLSGEMGVGKTYIGSSFASKVVTNGNVLIFAPNGVISKWQKVLAEFTNVNVTVYHPKTIKNYEGITLIKESMMNKFKENYTNLFIEQNNIKAIIIDEIHKYSGVKRLTIDHMLKVDNDMPITERPFKLFMTGTIFNVNFIKLGSLIMESHPDLVNITQVERFLQGFPASVDTFESMYANDIFKFVDDIWQYISLSISLDDLKTEQMNTQNDIRQTINPIVPIEETEEQRALSDLVAAQLSGLPDYRSSKIISSILDDPSRDLTFTISHRQSKMHIKEKSTIILSIPLTDISLKSTSKYQKFLKHLDDNPDTKTLVYANDEELMQSLQTQLTSDGKSALYISKWDIAKYGADFVNQQFKTYDIIIVNPITISVGVDIVADSLVWYQLIDDLQTILQAQRRIYRLSSTSKTTVDFLIYNEDYQVKLVEQVSNSAKYNAAAYGTNLKDNLAKLTGVLIPD